MGDETTCLKCGTRGVAEKVDHGIRLSCGTYLWVNGSTTESMTCLRRQLAAANTRIAELEGGMKWRPWDDNCPRCGDDVEVLTVLNDGTAYDGDEVRCVSCHAPGYWSTDGECGSVNWHEDQYDTCDCDYCKLIRENIALNAEIERLHCIMLVLVGEAALALGDDHELVARLRAIRGQTIGEAAKAAKETP